MSDPVTIAVQAGLGQYGRHFQEKVVHALVVDHKWAEQMIEVLKPEFFDLKHLAFLAKLCFDHWGRYRAFPSVSILAAMAREGLKHDADQALRLAVVECLGRLRSDADLADLPYVKERSLDFCRKAALRGAIEQSIDMMESERFESIVEIVKRAVALGAASTIGHDFLNEPAARFERRNRNPVPTGLAQLDARRVLNGGLGRGELGVVCAPTGVGKSHFLTFIGANAMRMKRNVVHYTLEMSESLVGVRYDSNLCGFDADEVPDHAEEILKRYSERPLGRLFIKEFPSCSATVNALRGHLEKLAARNFRPDLLVVDYADIMRSTRQYDAKRFELQLIYQELRGLASELDLPIWTASQSNKEGSNADVVDLSNMSEAYAKAMEADVVVSISRRSDEKAAGTGRFFVAKNRIGRDGLLFPITIDTARSQFVLHEQADFHRADDETAAREKLRSRLAELSDTPELRGITT